MKINDSFLSIGKCDAARKYRILRINTRNIHYNWHLLSKGYPGLTAVSISYIAAVKSTRGQPLFKPCSFYAQKAQKIFTSPSRLPCPSLDQQHLKGALLVFCWGELIDQEHSHLCCCQQCAPPCHVQLLETTIQAT